MSIQGATSPEATQGPSRPLSRRAVWANLTSVSGAHAVIHATVVLMPLVYPILRQEYDLSYTQIGLLVAIPSLIGGFLQLLFGYLGRYVSRKLMIGMGNLVVALSMFFIGLVTTFGGFLGWSIVRGIGGASQQPVRDDFLRDGGVVRLRGTDSPLYVERSASVVAQNRQPPGRHVSCMYYGFCTHTLIRGRQYSASAMCGAAKVSALAKSALAGARSYAWRTPPCV